MDVFARRHKAVVLDFVLYLKSDLASVSFGFIKSLLGPCYFDCDPMVSK